MTHRTIQLIDLCMYNFVISIAQVKEEFQTEMEHQEEICHQLQTKLDNSCHDNDLLRQSKEMLTEELEDMRERMTEAQFTLSQLSMEVSYTSNNRDIYIPCVDIGMARQV